MTAVGLSKNRITSYITRLGKEGGAIEVTIGCVNGLYQLRVIKEWLTIDIIFHRRLRVPVAYRSRFMDKVAVMLRPCRA